MMGHTKIKHGLQPSKMGAPVQKLLHENRCTGRAALLGADCPGLRPTLTVAQGDRVAIGQIVFTDRKNPDVAFAAPLAGRVSSIDYGPRRTLSALVIEAEETKADEDAGSAPINDASDVGVRKTLLKRGFWPAFQKRPFGGIPAPDATPAAIFVNAMQPSPLAPAPGVVLEDLKAEFQQGVDLLTRLTDGPVYVCQAPQSALGTFSGSVKGAFFSGTLASGLSGTHIDRLYPVNPDHQVWSIGYQDVVAIGHLFLTGQYLPDRVISIVGPGAAEPKLVRTCLGADIHALSSGEITVQNGQQLARVLSGDEMTGREAGYLGRYHQQITIADKPSEKRSWRLLSRPSTAQGALIPTGVLEQALAVDIPPVPLMRALSVGDSEAAKRLGCLALVEEDVAALTELCTSGADYGVLLRQVLNDLAGEAA